MSLVQCRQCQNELPAGSDVCGRCGTANAPYESWGVTLRLFTELAHIPNSSNRLMLLPYGGLVICGLSLKTEPGAPRHVYFGVSGCSPEDQFSHTEGWESARTRAVAASEVGVEAADFAYIMDPRDSGELRTAVMDIIATAIKRPGLLADWERRIAHVVAESRNIAGMVLAPKSAVTDKMVSPFQPENQRYDEYLYTLDRSKVFRSWYSQAHAALVRELADEARTSNDN